VAEVATASFYEWLGRSSSPTEAELEEALLVNKIIDIHAESDSTYGSPRVHAALRRHGFCTNHKRVERLMATHAIVGVTERRRAPRTTMTAEGAPPLPDLVGQDFGPGEPDRRWCGDITYVATDEGWLYLASVLDLGSRRLVGWAMDATMPASLVADALNRAMGLRGGDVDGVVFHSDRGSQYLSREYRELCDRHGVVQSAGRVATCLFTG
jgi:transposase InsO family protein